MIDVCKVGHRIAELRQGVGLTQSQLAVMMNVTHQAVSKWENAQAMPDIQTLLKLAQFFGLTVEQLIAPEEETKEQNLEETENHSSEREIQMEENKMNIQQLLQMAPYMTKEAVEEIALSMEGKLSANQIARLAPFLRVECVEALIEKHHPEFTWDSLRRLAPHMRRESVDELARAIAIASGRETIKSPEESINRTINDIGKAFDGLGKGVDKAVRKAIRFGGNVINEVSSVISELSNDAAAAPEDHTRSDRAQALRKRAFERALADGNWDWLGQHISELEDGDALKSTIAAKAREAGMHDWICVHMGGYADEFTIEAAIRGGNWSWLGENAWQLEPDVQRRVARAALDAENWQWLGAYSNSLDLGEDAKEIVRVVWNKGAKVLAAQIAKRHLQIEQIDAFAGDACAAGDGEMADLLWNCVSPTFARNRLMNMAQQGHWEGVKGHIGFADDDGIEKLMEIAVEQGNFDAVDFLDQYL